MFNRSRRRWPVRDTICRTSDSAPVSLTSAIVAPSRASCRRASSRMVPEPDSPIVTYEPNTTRSVPRLLPILPSVSAAYMSASASASSNFMRATFSPGMVRSASPAASSVVSISANAVESHTASARPVTFLKPSTAIDRRGALVGAAAPGLGPAGGDGSRQSTTASPTANATSKAPPITRRHVPAAAPCSSAATTSPARWNRSAGCRSRHRRIAASHDGSRSGTSRLGDGGASVRRRAAAASGVAAANGRTPVTISYITSPSAYTSVAGVTGPASTCSGAM